MGQLVMSFRGLCLHVNDGNGMLPDGVRHRIIAVNATQGANSQFGPLPAHHCFLKANQGTIDALSAALVPKFLDGWNVQVANALGPPVVVSIPNLPRLSTFSPDMSLWPDLRHAGAPAPDACCFVDIAMGKIEDHQFQVEGIDDPGFYSTWTVDTDGEPQLIFQPRHGSPISVTVPSTPEGETLRDENGVPGSIVLHNSTTTDVDSANDFALYYLARQGGIPSKFSRLLPGQTFANPAIDMTTSCSNSQYP